MPAVKGFLASALLLLILFCTGAAQDDDVISVNSSIVVVNAAVTDLGGKAVTGLDKRAFHIFENGVEQKIASFGAESTPFAAVILIDTSGSMGAGVSIARSAALRFLDGLRGDDFVAVYNFDSKVELVQDFSNSRDIRDRVYDLKSDGMTVLNDAIYKAAQALSERPEKRRAIVVLSDGADTLSKVSSDKALKAAVAVGASVYAVDMAGQNFTAGPRMQNQGVLKKFSERTGGRFIATPGGVQLQGAFTRIVQELGNQYTLTYEPSNLTKDGKWRAIELRIDRPGLTIRTRKGYNAPKK
jgi:VWFA-related protein